MRFDAIVIGAGVAGLAAARTLSGAGKTINILERHGRASAAAFSTDPRSNLAAADRVGRGVHPRFREPTTFVDRRCRVAPHVSASRQSLVVPRRSLADPSTTSGSAWTAVRSRDRRGGTRSIVRRFPRKAQRSLPATNTRSWRWNFVEGYHAAHAERISAEIARNLPTGEPGTGSLWTQTISHRQRLRRARLLASSRNRSGTLLAAPRHRRDRGGVAREGRGGSHSRWRRAAGRCAHDAVSPSASGKRPRVRPARSSSRPRCEQKSAAIEKLEIGHIVKIAFTFRERFWDDDDFVKTRLSSKKTSGPDALNFIHANDPHVPTWWTSAPVRSSTITAWAGGHAADRLLAEPPDSPHRPRTDVAVVSLRRREKNARRSSRLLAHA